ncbi:MAG: hypothetical protein KKA60_07980, partial [Proteobacteria bacterium]|nr:hypothetical protein [Pseudomonadota bacterium]
MAISCSLPQGAVPRKIELRVEHPVSRVKPWLKIGCFPYQPVEKHALSRPLNKDELQGVLIHSNERHLCAPQRRGMKRNAADRVFGQPAMGCFQKKFYCDGLQNPMAVPAK